MLIFADFYKKVGPSTTSQAKKKKIELVEIYRISTLTAYLRRLGVEISKIQFNSKSPFLKKSFLRNSEHRNGTFSGPALPAQDFSAQTLYEKKFELGLELFLEHELET